MKDKEKKNVQNSKEIKENTKEKSLKVKKTKKDKGDKKPNKFIEFIKKNWLINGTKTIILVLIIVAIFLAINYGVQQWDPTPIDLTQEKLYTLTDESKEKVKDIGQDVNIYFIGYSEDDPNLDLVKQYGKVNEKIKAESINIDDRPDLAQKYGIESGQQRIIVESGDRYKVLTASDLVTYDMTTGQTQSIAEKKFTSAILSVTTDKVPKVYFLEGYSDFSLGANMYYLRTYLSNEVNEIETLNILSTGKVPDDCDTLVITTPNKDFDDVATNAIIDYINSGRNILWLNAATTQSIDLPNVNKILALYGVKPFEVGAIRETNASNMLANSPDLIIPQMQYSPVTQNLYTTTGVVFANATEINIDEDNLENLNVAETIILQASEDSYFRSDFTNGSPAAAEGEAKGPFVVGAELDKTIQEADEENGTSAIESKLIIYGDNYFASDAILFQNTQMPAIALAYNRDLVIDSISYLVDRPEDISASKSTSTVTYTATEQQDTIVRIIIFVVPILIIIIGIIVWQVRRRRK